MTREEKILKKKARAKKRYLTNIARNLPKLEHKRNFGNGTNDCPYDVDIHGIYGTCHCEGKKHEDCLGDI